MVGPGTWGESSQPYLARLGAFPTPGVVLGRTYEAKHLCTYIFMTIEAIEPISFKKIVDQSFPRVTGLKLETHPFPGRIFQIFKVEALT